MSVIADDLRDLNQYKESSHKRVHVSIVVDQVQDHLCDQCHFNPPLMKDVDDLQNTEEGGNVSKHESHDKTDHEEELQSTEKDPKCASCFEVTERNAQLLRDLTAAKEQWEAENRLRMELEEKIGDTQKPKIIPIIKPNVILGI